MFPSSLSGLSWLHFSVVREERKEKCGLLRAKVVIIANDYTPSLPLAQCYSLHLKLICTLLVDLHTYHCRQAGHF
jgi:hypothetical protein